MFLGCCIDRYYCVDLHWTLCCSFKGFTFPESSPRASNKSNKFSEKMESSTKSFTAKYICSVATDEPNNTAQTGKIMFTPGGQCSN